MCEYLKALQKPFPAEDIEWRVSHAKKGMNGAEALVLAYVTNRAIMERLDEVFGIAGWKNEYREWRDKGVKCTLTCKVENEWISKEDGADVTDMEATKGGFSASMKRTAVQWGIGRYLYNLEQTWAPIRERGQNYINTTVGPKDKKEWVKGYWDTPKLPAWALPENYEQPETPPAQAAEPQLEDLDEILNDIEKASKENMAPKSETAKPDKAGQFATDGQVKFIGILQKRSEYSKVSPSELLELISAHLGKIVTEMKYIEKTDVNKIIKWLEESKAA